jgi:hypothetical protein
VARICDTETTQVGGIPIYAQTGSGQYSENQNKETYQRRDLLASSMRSATREISIILSAYPMEFRAPTRIQRKIVSVVYQTRIHRVRFL